MILFGSWAGQEKAGRLCVGKEVSGCCMVIPPTPDALGRVSRPIAGRVTVTMPVATRNVGRVRTGGEAPNDSVPWEVRGYQLHVGEVFEMSLSV